MNDTHGVTGEGWYGFDLDGTLAVYDKWKGIDHIGEPIKPMVDLIKNMHKAGLKVKILTARVAPRENPEKKPALFGDGEWGAIDFIRYWCFVHLSFIPEITHCKDHLMLSLFDDRVVQVEPNTGKVLGRIDNALSQFYHPPYFKCGAFRNGKCERTGGIFCRMKDCPYGGKKTDDSVCPSIDWDSGSGI